MNLNNFSLSRLNSIKSIIDTELWLVLKTQVAEYRRHSLLNLGFILSLAIACATLLSILILNHASRQQYQQADARLTSPVAYHVVAKQGRSVSKQDFSVLRKLGFTEVSPAISFRKQLASGKWISFKAMDLLALSITKPEYFDSDHILLSPTYAEHLGINDSVIELTSGQSMPVRYVAQADWGMMALLDIALAWELFPELKDFGYLMVTELTPARALLLEQSLPEYLLLQQSRSLQQRAGFADALHLNLSALAVLGFLVSLFIAFQAANQAWSKRSELMSQLRLLGVSHSTIRRALLLEGGFLILLTSTLGALLAIALVGVLLPLLGLTLNQLYQLRVSGHFEWNWQYGWWSLFISAVAVVLSLLRQLKTLNKRTLALMAKTRISQLSVRSIGVFGGVLILLFLLWPETGWLGIMIKYGLLLIASVALLPIALKLVVKLLLVSCNRRHFRIFILLQDALSQIGRRFLPLAAFYLALTTSIAAALMVNSFESAFVKYLDQQLNEDLYIRFNHDQKQQVGLWLEQRDDVSEYLLYRHGVASVGNDTVAITTYQSPRQLASLVLKSASSVAVPGCLVNEQLALAYKLIIGSDLEVTQGARQLLCQVQGIYFDYGNPRYEVTLSLEIAQNKQFKLSETGFGVYFSYDKSKLKQKLLSELPLNDSQLFEPAEIKTMARDIFSQTFLLTQAIAAVLLAIACFGLFLSAKSLELARKSDLIILVSLGYSKLELLSHMLGQWLLLAGGCIALSWPMASLLGHVLVAKVFPTSFGWSMPLVVESGPFVSNSLIGLACLLPALAIPLYRLRGLERR